MQINQIKIERSKGSHSIAPTGHFLSFALGDVNPRFAVIFKGISLSGGITMVVYLSPKVPGAFLRKPKSVKRERKIYTDIYILDISQKSRSFSQLRIRGEFLLNKILLNISSRNYQCSIQLYQVNKLFELVF